MVNFNVSNVEGKMALISKKIVIVVNNSWYAWNMRANLGFAFQKQGYEVVFMINIVRI